MTAGDVLVACVGALLCAAMLAALLRVQRPELAMGLGLAAAALVSIMLLRQLSPFLSALRRMLAMTTISTENFGVVLKAAGVCLMAQLTADTCRDAGESALAAKAELVGRVLMLLMALPLFEELLTLATSLIGGQVMSG
jgi:stage III sporulation protein AD